jgi:hypothetical protein
MIGPMEGAMNDTPEESAEEVITFNGKDIRKLRRAELIDALRAIYPDVAGMRQRLTDEGRLEAAREEDFQRDIRARRDFLGSAAEYQSRMFDASTAYNQIIVIGGYAAFFSIWSAFSKDIDRTVVLSSGVLILVSLIVYVTWTVVGMYQLTRRNIEATSTFAEGVEGFEERIQTVEVAAQQRSRSLLKFWRPVVWASGLTGFAAAALLSGAALWTMMPKPVPPRPDPIAAAITRADAAAAKAECNARVTALYARSRSGAGTMAINPKTGQRVLLVDGKWAVLPHC